ncbi:hypothetical protein VTO73DRAFT_2813 [Trametes versicolor]
MRITRRKNSVYTSRAMAITEWLDQIANANLNSATAPKYTDKDTSELALRCRARGGAMIPGAMGTEWDVHLHKL